MKNIMILGAGIYQMPLIKTAIAMGLQTHVISPKGQYPGLEIENIVHHDVDTTNSDLLEEIYKKFQIEGFCTCGTDVCIPAMGILSEKFNLNYFSHELATVFSDKILMKKYLQKLKIKTAKQYSVRTLIDIDKILETAPNEKFIVKPYNLSGSRYVHVVNDKLDKNTKDDLNHYITNYSKGKLILEEFIEGIEFGAQLMCNNGKIEKIFAHGDALHSPEVKVPIAHWMPFTFKTENGLPIDLILSKECEKLNGHIENFTGFINADFIYNNEGLHVIELGLRIGATGLPELIHNQFKFDPYQFIIENAFMNKPFTINNIREQQEIISVYGVFYADKSGKINYENLNLTYSEDCYIKFDNNSKIIKTKEFKNGTDRLGHIICNNLNINDPNIISNFHKTLNLTQHVRA